MIAALSFLLDYEKIEQENDSDESSDEEEPAHQPHVVVSKEAIYKVSCSTCDYFGSKGLIVFNGHSLFFH